MRDILWVKNEGILWSDVPEHLTLTLENATQACALVQDVGSVVHEDGHLRYRDQNAQVRSVNGQDRAWMDARMRQGLGCPYAVRILGLLYAPCAYPIPDDGSTTCRLHRVTPPGQVSEEGGNDGS